MPFLAAPPTAGHESDGTQAYDNPKLNFDEDCLYLNIWAPTLPQQARVDDHGSGLPVMVFFYGGSWNHGATSIPLLDGSYQVAKTLADGNPVISVTVNYRLGAYGFMAHPSLRDPADNSVGNYVRSRLPLCTCSCSSL